MKYQEKIVSMHLILTSLSINKLIKKWKIDLCKSIYMLLSVSVDQKCLRGLLDLVGLCQCFLFFLGFHNAVYIWKDAEQTTHDNAERKPPRINTVPGQDRKPCHICHWKTSKAHPPDCFNFLLFKSPFSLRVTPPLIIKTKRSCISFPFCDLSVYLMVQEFVRRLRKEIR